MIDSSLCMMDSAVDGAAMSELVLVLEQAKVVPDCSRRLFAAAMIRCGGTHSLIGHMSHMCHTSHRCGVSSLEALRESLSATPVDLDLIKDVGMNTIQSRCLMRWLHSSV